MDHVQNHPIRRWVVLVVAVALAAPFVGAIAPVAAEARVPCTVTMTGTNGAVINVPAGEKWCLRNLNQTGAVNVAPTGSLSVVRSTITGAVSLSSSRTLKVCRSTIVGAISASNGTGRVTIGNGHPSCRGNTLDGAVTLDSNLDGVVLARNGITDSVTASNNLEKTIISGNRIANDLTCNGNDPAPRNRHKRNRVLGTRTGQTCASNNF